MSNLEEIMVASYYDVFKRILTSEILDDEETAPEFHRKPKQYQREIEAEIDRKSKEMARTLVSKFKELGYLEKEPSDKELGEIIQQVLKQYGDEK